MKRAIALAFAIILSFSGCRSAAKGAISSEIGSVPAFSEIKSSSETISSQESSSSENTPSSSASESNYAANAVTSSQKAENKTASPAASQPAAQPSLSRDNIAGYAAAMSDEELVGQVILARCPGERTGSSDAVKYHLGGYILFANDFEKQTPESIKKIIAGYCSAEKIPMFIAVDEEGGNVTRVSRFPAFRQEPFASPRELYAAGGVKKVVETEIEKCRLLRSLGINLNLAPVCDITTDPEAFMYPRSLGLSPEDASAVIAEIVAAAKSEGVGNALKHFPGYGNNTDTHKAPASDNRPLEALLSADILPFRAGAAAGAGAVMISHTVVNCIDPSLPASLSPKMCAFLRETLGFDGVIMTDDLSMAAVKDRFGAAESAVLAVTAGADVLCSTDYAAQYSAVLAALRSGRISRSSLEQSAIRILNMKASIGLF